MSWTDGSTLPFDNDDAVVYVRTHPRLHCVDVFVQWLDKKRPKFLGRFDDRSSEWTIMHALMEDHPELQEVQA